MNVLGAAVIASLAVSGGCAATLRAPVPKSQPAGNLGKEEKQEDEAGKPKGEVRKPVDIQKCDYYGTCPVV